MITTAHPVTLFLARAIGAFLLARSIPSLMTPSHTRRIFEDYAAGAGIGYVAAFVSFAVGVALVAAHNYWSDPLAVAVTLVGWSATLEGLALAAFPAVFHRLRKDRSDSSRIPAIISIVFGVTLMAAGFIGVPTQDAIGQ